MSNSALQFNWKLEWRRIFLKRKDFICSSFIQHVYRICFLVKSNFSFRNEVFHVTKKYFNMAFCFIFTPNDIDLPSTFRRALCNNFFTNGLLVHNVFNSFEHGYNLCTWKYPRFSSKMANRNWKLLSKFHGISKYLILRIFIHFLET